MNDYRLKGGRLRARLRVAPPPRAVFVLGIKPGTWDPSLAWLAAIAAIAVIIRVVVISAGWPAFIDPDDYLSIADAMLRADSVAAFVATLADEGALRAPLYPVFLATFRSFRQPGLAALLFQAVLSGVTVAAVFSIATALSDRRAGWLAAALVAVWPPFVEAAPAFWSEHLHIPLVASAFAIAAHATRTGRLSAFAAAGGLFGAAALARAMPLFYLPIAAGIIMLGSQSLAAADRAARRASALALAAGFALVTLPYIVMVSVVSGDVVPIETEGTMGLYRSNPPGDEIVGAGARAPGAVDAVVITARQFAAAPVHFMRAQLSRVRGLLTPAWWFPPEAERHVTWWWVLSACLVVLVLLAAPFAWTAATDRPLLHLLAAWIAVHVVLVPLSGNTGARYRAPVDPALIALASAALAQRLRSWL